MNGFNLRILESNSIFYEGLCDSLIVPTDDGMYGVLASHTNTVLAIKTGILKYHIPNEEEFHLASVAEGMLKIEDNEVLLLTDSAEHPEEIDAKRELAELKEAREIILQKKSKIEHQAAELAIARALNRLKLKGYDTDDPLS